MNPVYTTGGSTGGSFLLPSALPSCRLDSPRVSAGFTTIDITWDRSARDGTRVFSTNRRQTLARYAPVMSPGGVHDVRRTGAGVLVLMESWARRGERRTFRETLNNRTENRSLVLSGESALGNPPRRKSLIRSAQG